MRQPSPNKLRAVTKFITLDEDGLIHFNKDQWSATISHILLLEVSASFESEYRPKFFFYSERFSELKEITGDELVSVLRWYALKKFEVSDG